MIFQRFGYLIDVIIDVLVLSCVQLTGVA